MKAALILVDLQNDFLARRPLEPSPDWLVARAARLLRLCRERGVPVVHARMSVTRDPDNRLPHWKREGRWLCVEGTPGHAFPAPLEPIDGETVIDKPGFDAFEDGRLAALLQQAGVDTVVVAGLYLHNCIRATALSAWRAGFDVILAEDAIGHYDPLEAEGTVVFLVERGLRFQSVRVLAVGLGASPSVEAPLPDQALVLPALVTAAGTASGDGPPYVHRSPADPGRILWTARSAGPDEMARAVKAATAGGRRVRLAAPANRTRWLEALSARLADPATAERLATLIATDVGKPLRDARLEIGRCRHLLAAAVRHGGAVEARTFNDHSMMRRVPLGVIAAVTPWNHPLAIAVGKIAPAVLHGNSVVWKPAPAAARLAVALWELMREAGWPDDGVTLILGGVPTARGLMNAPGVDAITLTGGPAAGMAARRAAALHHRPLQAELGGNNAAIVWSDADLEAAARQIAPAAFGFAGQRCTANRRVIVARECLDPFLDHVAAATRALVWGDPLQGATTVGPLISEESRERVAFTLEAAEAGGHRVFRPHLDTGHVCPAPGWFLAPAVVVCGEAGADVVQRESFGPVLVVQPADSWDEAIGLLNGVEQGLVAAVFTASPERWGDFRERALAGILKWNRATADAGVEAPFGGWKASGIGPPEHGPANLEFYTRSQALYEG